MYGTKPTFPYVLGSDGAGTVAAVGAQGHRFKEGDHAYALALTNPKGGFYAEYAVVKADNVSPIPKKLTVEQASVMPSDALTALRGLDEILKLNKSEWLMVFGAGGGSGHIAVQLAKRMGARVFAVASGADGVELALRVGADVAVDGRKDDVAKAVLAYSPEGVDAALVLVGSKNLNDVLEVVKPGGRIAH